MQSHSLKGLVWFCVNVECCTDSQYAMLGIDLDGDGVSGRVAVARDPATGKLAIGRFGWKAGEASIRSQSAGAFAGDMGISSPLVDHPYGDCTAAQADCLAQLPSFLSCVAPGP